MTIRRMPEIEKKIANGAPVKEDVKSNKMKVLSLQIPQELVDAIDRLMKEYHLFCRSAWIREACIEKLKRMQKE